MTKHILTRMEDDIGYITLNRPDKLNALTESMLDQLEQAVAEFDRHPGIRVVILHAAGARAFCVGADITAWAQYSALDFWRHWVKRGHRVFDGLAALRQPVIAAVQGHVLGGGLELALTADIRVGEQSVTLGLPETGIATLPGWSGSQRLNQLVNPSIIKEMVFTGNRLDSARAYQLGLLNHLCPDGQALATAKVIARQIAERAPIAVQLGKQVIDAGAGNRLEMVLEGIASGFVASTEDAQEGIASFQEKRKPNYSGK